jgi:hypothetical protein
VTTQLRLVEPPRKQPKRAGSRTSRATVSKTITRAKATAARPRRAVHWGDWQLDDRTRKVGREGVAAARRALHEARVAQELRRAS